MPLIYDFLDYRDYLNAWLAGQPGGGHGLRKKIADNLRCQSAFVSQVLHKAAHLSLEHGFKLNEFLAHNAEESDYFVLILLYQRAGSPEVRDYFRGKIEAVHKSRLVLNNRIRAKSSLSSQDKARYYSAWHYSAIRLLVSIPGFNTKEQIASRLRLRADVVSRAVDFLLRTGLLVERDGKYADSEQFMHLPSDSPHITKHHTNWRLLALDSMTADRSGDFHYSLGVTLSKEDIVKIKARLVEFVVELQKVVHPSPSESLCGFCLDWFEV